MPMVLGPVQRMSRQLFHHRLQKLRFNVSAALVMIQWVKIAVFLHLQRLHQAGLMSLRAAKTVYSYITRVTTVTVSEPMLGAIMCVVIGFQMMLKKKDSVKQLVNIVTAR
jgi:cAMP phosphodiesterase